MEKDETTEFSFILKPAEHGIGVFATHDIKEGAYLRLFGSETEHDLRARVLKKSEVPEIFWKYTLDRENDMMLCPLDFGEMAVGWYLNHSKTPNVIHRDLHCYAARDIKAGEEITIDYNTLGEPEESKEEYQK